jgi:hypothetical protein
MYPTCKSFPDIIIEQLETGNQKPKTYFSYRNNMARSNETESNLKPMTLLDRCCGFFSFTINVNISAQLDLRHYDVVLLGHNRRRINAMNKCGRSDHWDFKSNDAS